MKRFKWLLRSLIIGSGMLLVAVTPQPVHAQDLTVRSELIPSQKQQLAQENWESYLANFLIDSNSSIHEGSQHFFGQFAKRLFVKLG
ncbi:MAG: hypothetical protein L0G21_05585, partial [Lactococcus raffinolactis]|nr:hypothetical protein [Lactococcus raffinolactis]